MAGRSKKIVTIAIVTVFAIIIIGFALWNKPGENIAAANGIKTDAATLYKTFVEDSVTANKNYGGQIVEVSGTINNVSVNQQKETIVTINTGTSSAYINCTMEEQPGALQPGVMIKIKGKCFGLGQGDPDLGIMGDVYLVRCYVVK
jgi:hypothetical protein